MTQDRSEWRRLSLEEEEEDDDDLEVGAATETTLDDASDNINNNKAESSSLPDHLEDEDDDDFADRTLQQRRRRRQQQMIRAILFLTFLFESVTCFFHFGLGMESTQQTANTVGRYTGGIRIHHGYLGIVLLLIVHTTTTCSRTASSSSSSSSRHYCCCCCHHHQQGAYAAAVAADSAPHWIWWMRVVGWSLIASDLIHHFLVLWPLTGSPHFDLAYPKRILYCMFYGEQISCDVI